MFSVLRQPGLAVGAAEPALPRVALVHDYLTQRGGAERVALELTRAFPGAPLYTTAYDADATFAGFRGVDVRVVPWLNRVGRIRRNVRAAFPVLPLAVRAMGVIDADVVVCSSSGWGHGVATTGRKLVYCHNPARWLYQPDAYFSGLPPLVRRLASLLLTPWRLWDRRAAATVDEYLANSANVAGRIQRVYGRAADVVHPPRGLDPAGEQEPVPGVEPGYYLTVSRKRGYKRSREIAEAIAGTSRRLVQVGGEAADQPNVTRLTGLSDAQLRWLYAHARALIAVGDEDFGLTPVECYAFGTPAVVLAAGGYLETADPVSTVLVPEPSVQALRSGLDELEATTYDRDKIREHAEKWSPTTFHAAVQAHVRALAGGSTEPGAVATEQRAGRS